MNSNSGAVALVLAMAACPLAAAEKNEPRATQGDPYANETAAQRDARMAWWREAKFGMFIHWGVYAVPAGVHEGVRDAEWIMRAAKIPAERYRAYARDFNPVDYNPESWVNLAKTAGMKYMIITAKHHDGFALFPTRVSDWNVIDATPYHNDLIAPLASAARAKGLKFGLYYSHSQDWVNPGGAKWRIDEGDGWDEAHKGSYDEYLDRIAVPQVREILTLYQPDVLWWDTPHYMTQPRAEKLIGLLKLRPGIIHNDRLGGGYHGDTETPENFIPPAGYPGRDWETCMTTNDNWGYVRDDHDWRTIPQIIANLVDIVSKGGNYLLNVGPDSKGDIPREAIQLLTRVGAWMDANGEAIYGSHASPFRCRLPWGRCTLKPKGENTVLYLHVLDWPENQRILLPGLQNKVHSAELLVGGGGLEVEDSPHGPVVKLPTEAPDDVSTTLKLEIEGSPVVKTMPLVADPDGVIRLTPVDARIGGKLHLEQRRGVDYVSGWNEPEDTISWNVEATQAGRYLVRMKCAGSGKGAVIMINGIGKLAFTVPESDDIRVDFKTSKLGEITLEKGQKFTVGLQAVRDGWHTVNVQSLQLIPQP